jgi:hypothetical protein
MSNRARVDTALNQFHTVDRAVLEKLERRGPVVLTLERKTGDNLHRVKATPARAPYPFQLDVHILTIKISHRYVETD